MNSKITSIREAFGQTLLALAKLHPDLYVVNADLKSSLYLSEFAAKYPRRFIECGVAESNAAAVAAGLAKSGKTVFLTSFACFSPAINWAVIKQSICLNDTNVKIIGSHAGLMSGDLGATHQMLEDVALMRALPNMEVFAPLDALECEKIVKALVHSPHPAYLRLVRPASPQGSALPFTIGKSVVLQKGKDVTVCGYGPILLQALDIKKWSLEIINCSSLKPLDDKTILKSLKKTKRLLVIEDHQQNGGLGEALSHLLLSKNCHVKFKHLAVNDAFGQSATDYHQLWNYYGLGPAHLTEALRLLMAKKL